MDPRNVDDLKRVLLALESLMIPDEYDETRTELVRTVRRILLRSRLASLGLTDLDRSILEHLVEGKFFTEFANDLGITANAAEKRSVRALQLIADASPAMAERLRRSINFRDQVRIVSLDARGGVL